MSARRKGRYSSANGKCTSNLWISTNRFRIFLNTNRFRQLDPTTKAWDEKHKRDPNYWKNFDLRKAFDAMVDAVDKCEAFDWDSLPTDHVPPEAKARASSMAQLFKE